LSYQSFRSHGSNWPREKPGETAARSFLQLGFEKMVSDDQRVAALTRITAARRDVGTFRPPSIRFISMWLPVWNIDYPIASLDGQEVLSKPA
jgi:hypothetical protein